MHIVIFVFASLCNGVHIMHIVIFVFASLCNGVRLIMCPVILAIAKQTGSVYPYNVEISKLTVKSEF